MSLVNSELSLQAKQPSTTRREIAISGSLGLVVALAVCLPWVNGGWLMLLDWVPSPHVALIPNQVYGLSGGLIAALPLGLLDNLFPHLLGQYASVIEITAFFVTASIAMSQLVGGRRVQRLSASLLFCVNPFVFDRLNVGQINILIGYALLPFALRSLLDARERSFRAWVIVGLWWVVLISCTPHYAWIFAVPVVVVALFNATKPRTLLGVTVAVLVGLVSTSYVLVAGLIGGVGVQVGPRNLHSFQTTSDPHLGLFVNVLGLYGFWRLGPTLAKQVVTGWPVLLAGILGVTLYGYLMQHRSSKGSTSQRHRVLIIAISGLIGLILAMGSQGPFGWLFSFAYFHIPYFNIMREPEKFSSLLAVGEAVGFGWGVNAMYDIAKGKTARILTVAIAAVLVIAYEPLIFYGLFRQAKTSEYPTSWYAANKLMGTGDGVVLALPWHQYLSYPFTQERVVANLSPGFFTRAVISGNNAQLPNIATTSTSRRSAFLQYAYDNGATTHYFGSLLAPLGVKYVVLEKAVDWRSYSWLLEQQDLKQIMNSKSIEVFRNLAYAGVGYRTPSAITVPNWGSIIALSETNQLIDKTVLVDKAVPGPIVMPTLPPQTSPTTPPRQLPARRVSPTTYDIKAGEPGWIQLAEPYTYGWTLNNHPGVQLAEGNIGWPSNGSASIALFSPVDLVLGGEALSLLTVLAAGGYLLVTRTRKSQTALEGEIAPPPRLTPIEQALQTAPSTSDSFSPTKSALITRDLYSSAQQKDILGQPHSTAPTGSPRTRSTKAIAAPRWRASRQGVLWI
ncbi:MAG: hypothetical protein ACYDHP_05775 [Ferrimicrobium sp.]